MNEYFYVIMPISSDTEYALKKEIIKKIAKMNKIKTHLPFEDREGNSSTLFSEVSGASFVFADLSFERPSCYYELGVAQALGKLTFIVARSGTHIHQVQGDVHYYNNLKQYEELVRKAIEESSS